ncbi:MAG: HesA/MoeB/ThiF family protein [Methanimicrococcus sp.]|nr:HesA/MoeB/ThiF family protein [Methanimicrococcus sp.]
MDQISKRDDSSSDSGSCRYDRQLPIFGEAGQRRLAEASVFIAGTGGLGSPVATYLAAAGVGRIVLLDCDSVEVTNLNRQFLHHASDIGRKKAVSGRDKLKSFNPEIDVSAVCEKMTRENVAELVGDCRIIADALDNDEARRILAEYAAVTKRPYFHAAVSGYAGQLASFYPEEGPCYFCVFSETEDEKELKDVKETEDEKKVTFPIVGATAGIIGSMQANAIIQYITDAGSRHTGKLFVWDGRTGVLDVIETERNDECPVCGRLGNSRLGNGRLGNGREKQK